MGYLEWLWNYDLMSSDHAMQYHLFKMFFFLNKMLGKVIRVVKQR